VVICGSRRPSCLWKWGQAGEGCPCAPCHHLLPSGFEILKDAEPGASCVSHELQAEHSGLSAVLCQIYFFFEIIKYKKNFSKITE